jgi:hypothetical protein
MTHAARQKIKRAKNAPEMHFVFSTSCNTFQYWQSELLLNSAMHVKQKGRFTQIVVGCDESEAKGMAGKGRVLTHDASGDTLVGYEQWNKSSHPTVRRIFAPAIPEAKEFPWFNKPWSFEYWRRTENITGDVIVLLDPDEFFIRPLSMVGSTRKRHLKPPPQLGKGFNDLPKPGMGVGAYYGIGGEVIWKFKDFLDDICGAGSPCATMTARDAENWQSVGPPYILVVEDFRKIVPLWWEYMPKVYPHVKGDILADMYAYQMAAANANVLHSTVDDFMVSAAMDMRQGWATVDSAIAADVPHRQLTCDEPFLAAEEQVRGEIQRLNFGHLAEHYKACTGGEKLANFYEASECAEEGAELFNFHKGHMPPGKNCRYVCSLFIPITTTIEFI